MDKAQYETVPVELTEAMMVAMRRSWFGSGCAHIMTAKAATDIHAAMLAAAPQPPNASGEREGEAPRWILVSRPGKSAERKGPWLDGKQVETMLRELYDAYPDATCLVVRMPNTSYPEDGREWLSIYGDRRRKRVPSAPSPGIDAAEQKPVGYVDPISIVNLTAATSDKEWMWRQPSAGLVPAYAAPPAAQPSADNAQFPFYELRFIMRVLGHKGSAPKEDWATAYGMARQVFEQWSKDSKAAEGWLAEAERLVDDYAKEFSQGGATYAREIRRAALLAHLKARS